MNLLPPDPAQSQTPVNLLIVDDVPQNRWPCRRCCSAKA